MRFQRIEPIALKNQDYSTNTQKVTTISGNISLCHASGVMALIVLAMFDRILSCRVAKNIVSWISRYLLPTYLPTHWPCVHHNHVGMPKPNWSTTFLGTEYHSDPVSRFTLGAAAVYTHSSRITTTAHFPINLVGKCLL